MTSKVLYSLHQKKVYTCDKAMYSILRGARGKVLFIWPPSVLSTQLDKSVYFLLVETVDLSDFQSLTESPLNNFCINHEKNDFDLKAIVEDP